MHDRIDNRIGLAVSVLALGLWTAGAQAQEPITTSPSAVQECLCAQRAVTMMNNRVQTERQRYERMRENSDNLSRQVDAGRGRVDTNNRGDIDAFSALLARRDGAAQSFRAESQRYSAMVARYNNTVGRSNAACNGRLFDQEEVESIKANLVCSRP